jgi:hypothetical protein
MATYTSAERTASRHTCAGFWFRAVKYSISLMASPARDTAPQHLTLRHRRDT